MSGPTTSTQINPDAAVAMARRILGGQISEAQALAIRRAIEGRVIAGRGPGATPAVVIQSLSRVSILEIVADGPMCAVVGSRLATACRQDSSRADAAAIDGDLVTEYLGALDERRKLAVTDIVSSSGRAVRGCARANVVASVQRRLEAAEIALRKATNTKGTP